MHRTGRQQPSHHSGGKCIRKKKRMEGERGDGVCASQYLCVLIDVCDYVVVPSLILNLYVRHMHVCLSVCMYCMYACIYFCMCMCVCMCV